MKPDEVPADLLDVFCRAHWAAGAHELVPGVLELARTVLAAVLPAHEAMVRAKVAEEQRQDEMSRD